ncbi:MAG: MerR family transcriptional regulator [Cyanobacteria bacterium P01_D01_bin.44]
MEQELTIPSVASATLTIQQVAKATGLSVHTLRYYERCDLIAPIHRARNGHRRYSAQDINWIKFLTKLRLTGMPIRQMQQYATLLREQPDAVEERRALLEAHRQTVLDHLQQLQENLAVIDWKIQHYKEVEQKFSKKVL